MHYQLGTVDVGLEQGVQPAAMLLLLGRDMGSAGSAEVWLVRQVHGSKHPYSC